MSGWSRFNQPEYTDTIAAVEVDELLMSLVEKNLVVRDEITGRYRLLETIRDYGRGCFETLEEAEALRNRHLYHFLAMSEEAEPHLTGAEQQTWLDGLDREHENLRAALEWSSAVGGDSEDGLRLAGYLYMFWAVRGHFGEGRRWLAELLDARNGVSRSAIRAKALNGAGWLAYNQGEYVAARALHEETLAISRELGDRWGIAGSLGGLGGVAYDQGDYRVARALSKESLAIRRELGDRWGIGWSLNILGLVAYEQGDYPAARVLFEESLAIDRELGDHRGAAGSLGNLGNVAHEQDDYPAALALQEESLAIRREMGDRWGAAFSLEGSAAVIASLGDTARAVRIWGSAERLREEIGSPIPRNERPRYERQVAAARAALNDDVAFDAAWNEGRKLTMDQAISLALEES